MLIKIPFDLNDHIYNEETKQPEAISGLHVYVGKSGISSYRVQWKHSIKDRLHKRWKTIPNSGIHQASTLPSNEVVRISSLDPKIFTIKKVLQDELDDLNKDEGIVEYVSIENAINYCIKKICDEEGMQ